MSSALWNKLIASRNRQLVAEISDDLYVCLQQGTSGSTNRLMLSWGNNEQELAGMLINKNRAVYADDLNDLIQQGKKKNVDITSIPLANWREA